MEMAYFPTLLNTSTSEISTLSYSWGSEKDTPLWVEPPCIGRPLWGTPPPALPPPPQGQQCWRRIVWWKIKKGGQYFGNACGSLYLTFFPYTSGLKPCNLMIMILFVKLVTYLFVCKVEGDVRSDEESGPEEEKAEINKVDGVLDNKKKLQWRTGSSPVILKERALYYISINLLFFLRSDANGSVLTFDKVQMCFLYFLKKRTL